MSITRKNKRWYVDVDVPAGPDGKRRRRGVGGFKTKREAKAAEAEALRRVRNGVFVEPSRFTVGAYLMDMWRPSMASQVRATTLGGYRHNVRAYIVPKLGMSPFSGSPRLTWVPSTASWWPPVARVAGRCPQRRSVTSTRRSGVRSEILWRTA